MITRRTRRSAPRPKPRPKPKPVAKAKAPGKLINPYKPKAPITLPPGTKFKPIPPGVRTGPVGGGKPSIPTRKPKPKARRKPRIRKATTRTTRRRRVY